MSNAARGLLGLVALLWLAIAGIVWWLWPVIVQLADPDRPQSFTIPSASMLPTLRVDDRIRPRRLRPGEPVRGQVVVLQLGSQVRVGRVVGLEGDRVAMRGGRLWLDGATVPLRDLGAWLDDGPGPSRLQRERLPGEPAPHRLIDGGASAGDDYGPIRVPAHHLFLLGDNRDRAADSRFPPAASGMSLVAQAAVVGIVDRLLWSRGLRDLGRTTDAEPRP